MALRIMRVGDSWPNHLERNILEFWRVDDDAGGAVTAGSIELKNQVGPPAIVAGVSNRPIGAIGCPYSINPANNKITLYYSAASAGLAQIFTVIYEPGAP